MKTVIRLISHSHSELSADIVVIPAHTRESDLAMAITVDGGRVTERKRKETMKWLLFIGVIFGIYCCMVGFLRTAEKAGWSESEQVRPMKSPLHK